MKKKNSEGRLARWLPRVAIALIIVPLAVPLMGFSFIVGLLYYDDASRTEADLLVESAFMLRDAFTILQRQPLDEPDEALYLVGWRNSKGTPCIGVIRVDATRTLFGSFFGGGWKADCDLARFSVDQFWGRRGEFFSRFSLAYGYSGDAARVDVTWHDKSVMRVKPVNFTYLARRADGKQVIASIEFYGADDALLHRFPRSTSSGRDES